jgi:hypothetical protein
MSAHAHHPRSDETQTTPLWPIVLVTALASIGTGVMWNGLAFIATSAFAFGVRETLLLALGQGVAYMAAAFLASRLVRLFAAHVAPRTLLGLILAVPIATTPLILVGDGAWTIWTIAIVVSAASAFQWPIIESYLAAGRIGGAMRSAIGWWNVVWMGSVALSLAATGRALENDLATWAVVALVPVHVACLACLVAFRPRPGDHLHDPDAEHPGERYRAQLATARVLLPVSYVVVAALSPLLPFLMRPFDLAPQAQTAIASIWLFARLAAVLVLWRTSGWHGRWATLFVAGVLIAAGFALAVLAPNALVLALGLALFGLGQGTIYYAAIYYALAVGDADVDAAGTHEGLIGVGYAIGPAIGLAAALFATTDDGRNQLTVLGIWLLMGLVAAPAIRPWTAERRRAKRDAEDASGGHRA